ncbi:MAG: hypothetical protein LBD85_06025 [Oscillospiraceae bacterium]|nr:hypothetical protein [Oscillospiraceae bacterium]
MVLCTGLPREAPERFTARAARHTNGGADSFGGFANRAVSLNPIDWLVHTLCGSKNDGTAKLAALNINPKILQKRQATDGRDSRARRIG